MGRLSLDKTIKNSNFYLIFVTESLIWEVFRRTISFQLPRKCLMNKLLYISILLNIILKKYIDYYIKNH